jgi:hypothetical protein
MSRKPIICSLENGVIHNDFGPAIAYKDGFAAYAIHGVRVDEQIVMRPETQTLNQIKQEDNEEVKRIRIERYGWQKYLQDTNAKVLDVSTHPQWMESLMQTDNMKILCTYDPSTGRIYSLEVDPRCNTCEQAQRYLLAPDEAFSRTGINTESIPTYPVLRT